MNDLLLVIPETQTKEILNKNYENGTFKFIVDNFIYKNIPYDYDVISFFLRISNAYHLNSRE